MTSYRFAGNEMGMLTKHGITVTRFGYDPEVAPATVVHVTVAEGHFQEFVNVESTYFYSVVGGRGTFYLDGEAVPAWAGDLIVAPPNTRIYYFGEMQMVLTVSPRFNEASERHIRYVSEAESPYL